MTDSDQPALKGVETMKEFRDWFEAYDYCREVDHPVIVRVTVEGIVETAKIYPSGTCKTLTRKAV